MRHLVKKKKLGRTKEHRLSLRYNLCRNLIMQEKIITTEAKMKFFVPFLEQIITKAKNDCLANYRLILAYMRNDEIVAKKIMELGEKFKERNGGYVEKFKLATRKSDVSKMCLIRFVA